MGALLLVYVIGGLHGEMIQCPDHVGKDACSRLSIRVKGVDEVVVVIEGEERHLQRRRQRSQPL